MGEVRIGVVGSGFIATHFITSLARHDGYDVSRVLTRRVISSLSGLPNDVATNSIDDLVANCDVVLESSGDPIWATDVVNSAVEAGKPVVTMNTEFHITTGSAFVGKGVVTEAEGDQPGCLAALHEDAKAMGFEPIAYGNMKGFLNLDPKPDEMAYWGDKQGISLPMVTSFTDGTKVQAEQILVANCFGATAIREGMLGPAVTDLEEASQILGSAAEEIGRPISDFVVSSALPHGVFLVATHDETQTHALEYFKMGPGPHYTIIKNNILVHLEILKTIKRALSTGSVLLDNSVNPELSLGAVVKRDLEPGERIESAIGSFEMRGHTLRTADHPRHVPIGLIRDATVEKPLTRDQIVTFGDISLPPSMAENLWHTEVLPAAIQGPS